MRALLMALLPVLVAGPAGAAEPAAGPVPVAGPIMVSRAWTPAVATPGGDNPLYMTIANSGDVPDSLIRAKCPVADFTEKVTVDSGGEGSPSTREVKAIPIPPGKNVVLVPNGYHIVLLHTIEPLTQGQTISCTVTFQKSGQQIIEATVAAAGAQTGP